MKSVGSRLREIIDAELDADPDVTPRERAKTIFHRELELSEEWTVEHYTVLIRAAQRDRSKKKAAKRDEPYQMFFPGFRSLDENIKTEQGQVTLRSATITDFRENLKLIRKTGKTTAELRTIAAIDGMAPYSWNRRGLTFERYCELKAAGVPPTPRKKARKRARQNG